MPVEKIPFRLKPINMTRASEATFQTSHEARVDRPLDDLDLNELFADVQPNLQVGDQVTICAYDGSLISEDRKLREIGTCRIIAKGVFAVGARAAIRAVWVGESFKVPATAHVASKKQITLKLEVKKEFGGGFTVRDEKGAVIESFKTKVEAEGYIAHLNGEPVVPKDAKLSGVEVKPGAIVAA